MWFAYMRRNDDTEECQAQEVPGPLPLNRRQAMANCEDHAKEYSNGYG